MVYMHKRTQGFYLVLAPRALHTETGEILTIYQNRAGEVFARPRIMFLDGRFALTTITPEELFAEQS